MSIRAKMHDDETITVSGIDFYMLFDIVTLANNRLYDIESRDMDKINAEWARKIRYAINRLEECRRQILDEDFAKHTKRNPEPEPTLKEILLKREAERVFINSIMEEALNASDE